MSAACSRCCSKQRFGQHIFGVEQKIGEASYLQWMGLGSVPSRNMMVLVLAVFSSPLQVPLLKNKSDDDASCDEALQISLLYSQKKPSAQRKKSSLLCQFCA